MFNLNPTFMGRSCDFHVISVKFRFLGITITWVSFLFFFFWINWLLLLDVNYFSKMVHLRCLTVFWIRLCTYWISEISFWILVFVLWEAIKHLPKTNMKHFNEFSFNFYLGDLQKGELSIVNEIIVKNKEKVSFQVSSRSICCIIYKNVNSYSSFSL